LAQRERMLFKEKENTRKPEDHKEKEIWNEVIDELYSKKGGE